MVVTRSAAAAPLVVRTTARLARKHRVLTITLSATRLAHVDLQLRKQGVSVGHWHRWIPAGKTNLRLWARGARGLGTGVFALEVSTGGGGMKTAGSVHVAVTG